MLFNRLYYQVKPILPPSLRIGVRRFWAKRKRQAYQDVWPINPVASQPPAGWPGWPGGKQFALVLTHDVEGRRGLEQCRKLMDLETRLGFRASYNFIPQGDYSVPKDLREELIARGFEVGVHDLRHDGKLYWSRKSFRAHAKLINRYLEEWGAVGFRSGFMLRRLDWLHDLNILYDASTFDTDPFEPQPEGVNTIFPFWVATRDANGRTRNSAPNAQAPAQRGYVELPYTLPQDSTLFTLFQEPSIATWQRKLDWIVEHGGMALLNVHPDYISFEGRRSSLEYGVQFYEDFLHYVAQRYRDQCWFALPREVAEYVCSSYRPRCPEPDADLDLDPWLRPAPDHSHQECCYNLDSNSRGEASLASVSATVALRPEVVPGRDALVEALSKPRVSHPRPATISNPSRLRGKRAAVVLFSHYPGDPRPRRAAEIMVREGMEVELICLVEDDNDPKRETHHGVDILRIPLKRRRGGKFAYVYQYAAFIVVSFAVLTVRSLTRRYDLVHVHNMPDVLVLSALVPKALGAKVILDLHDPMPELMMTIFNLQEESRSVRLLKHLEKWSIRTADQVLTVNLACKKIFAARSCAPEKIGVIMNSPDEQIFQLCPPPLAVSAERDPAKPFIIMYHGSLVERHGLDLAVQALAQVRESIPAAQLRIYGQSTPFLEQVMDSVRDRGLHQTVHYLGPKKLEQIVKAIEECDVGIIPNRRSIFTEINTPTRIFEYLALGKPVIAPRAPGIEDYFGPGDLVFFELGSETDLTQQIRYVHSHPAEVREIIRRGQDIYMKHRWNQESRSLVCLVDHLLTTEAERR